MTVPSPATSTFIRVAIVGGTAILAITLLWVMEVVSFPVFIGGLVVIAAAEGVAIMRAVRRAQRAVSTRQVDTTVAPGTAAPGTVGYDPMDGLRGSERPFDGR